MSHESHIYVYSIYIYCVIDGYNRENLESILFTYSVQSVTVMFLLALYMFIYIYTELWFGFLFVNIGVAKFEFISI